MINGDTTQNVYKRKTLILTEEETYAMTSPNKVTFPNPMEKTYNTNTYVRDEKDFLLSKQYRKAKIKGRLSLGQHMNKDAIFNDYDAQNKNYTNLILLSQQKRTLQKETNELTSPEKNNDTSYITNNEIQTVVHKKGKLSSYIINPKKQKQCNIINPSKSTDILKQEIAHTPMRNSKKSSQVSNAKTDNRMKHKNNSQYTIHIPGGMLSSRSRSKKTADFQTPYRPPNVSSQSVNTCNDIYTGTPAYEYVFTSPVACTTFSGNSCKTNMTPLKDSSEKVIELMKGSNTGGKVDFIRRFELYDYIKKYKIKKVIFIQRMYKERYAIRYRSAVIIQSTVRMLLLREYVKNYYKLYYYFLAAFNHIENVAKRKARLRDVYYKIKIQAMLNAEYTSYITKYSRGKRNDRYRALYEKAIVEIDTIKRKLGKSEGRYLTTTFSNVEIEKEVNAFNLNGNRTDEKRNKLSLSKDKIEPSSYNNTDGNVESLKNKRPIKRNIVDDIDDTAKEEQLFESEILIDNDIDDEIIPISQLRSKRGQHTDTISSQMNTEDNLQSDRNTRFKSKKPENKAKRSLTIDKNVNISLTNRLKCFDVNSFNIAHEEVDMRGRKKEKMKISNEDRFVLDRYYEKVNLEKIRKKKMKELKISKDRGFSMGKLKKPKMKLELSNIENVLYEGKGKKNNQLKIDNNELTIKKQNKEKPIYQIESMDILIEDTTQNKKKILKSRRKPQSNNKYKISSDSITLSSDIPTESSINRIKEQLYKDKLAGMSISNKNMSLCFTSTKHYSNESSQTTQSSNSSNEIETSSFLIKSSPKPKEFNILKPIYHKNTLSIGSTPKTPSFNQKKLNSKSPIVLSFIGTKQSSFDSIKPNEVNKISLSYHNKSFSSLSSSTNESINYQPNDNYSVDKFTKNNSPILANEITIEQEKKKIEESPILHTNNNLSISSGLNAMELITESIKDNNSEEGNKEEIAPLLSNRSLLNRAYNKYFNDLIGNNTNDNNEGNKSVRTNNNNVSIVSIDNYIMYNMSIVSSSFELIANLSNEKISKAVLPVRLIDIIKRTVGKDVIDTLADRPSEKLKGKRLLKSRRNNDLKKRSLMKATKIQCDKPLKRVFNGWKREVLQKVLYDKIKEATLKELSYNKSFALSYYDKVDREAISKDYSIKYPMKLSYHEDKASMKDKELSYMNPISLSYRKCNKNNNDELSFKHILALSYYEDKHKKTFDEETLSFKHPLSLSYKEKKNTFDKDTLSFNYPTVLSYKDNRKNFDEGKMSFKYPVQLSYKENKFSFNEDTLSFKQQASLSYKDNNIPSKEESSKQSSNQIASTVIKCSYNDKANNKNAIDKDFSYIYPSKLSFYEEKKENDSNPARLSNNDKTFSGSDSEIKHVSSLSYNEFTHKNIDSLSHSHQFSLSFHDESIASSSVSIVEPIQSTEESTSNNNKKKLLKSKRRPNKPKQIEPIQQMEEEKPKEIKVEEDNHSEEEEEDRKTLITIRQRKIVKLKRRMNPIQELFLKKIFFKRWKSLAPYQRIMIRERRIKKTIKKVPSCPYHDITSYLNLRHCFKKWKKLKSLYIKINKLHLIVAKAEYKNLYNLAKCFCKWNELSYETETNEQVEFTFSPRTEVSITPVKGIRVKLIQKDKSGLSKTINVRYSSDKKKKSSTLSDKSDKQYKGMKITKKYVPVNTQNMDKIILFNSSIGEPTALKDQLRKLREIVLKLLKRSSFMKWKVNNNKRRIMLQFLDEFSSNNKRLSKYFLLGMIKNYMNDGRTFKELSDEKFKKGIAMLRWYRLRKKKTNCVINIKEITKYRYIKPKQ